MKLKLKEKPSEWRKFFAVLTVIPVVASVLLWRKRGWDPQVFYLTAGIALALIVLSFVWTRPFRVVYRVGMTASFYVGQVMGTVLLTLFFFLLVTPLSLALRLAGKDLLSLRRSKAASYWQPAKNNTHFDRQF